MASRTDLAAAPGQTGPVVEHRPSAVQHPPKQTADRAVSVTANERE